MKLKNFGALVIGKARADAQEAIVEEGRIKFGPLVLGDKVQKGTNTPATDSEPVVAAVSLERLKEILAENPAYFMTYYEQELVRPSGPRRGALRLFLEIVPDDLAGREKIVALCENLLELPVDADSETVSDAIQAATDAE